MTSDRLLAAGVGLLLLGIPWHELIVRISKPLGAWDEAVLLGLALALAARGRRGWRPCPFLAPLLAMGLAAILSILVHGGSLGPLRAWVPYTVAGVAACQLGPERARTLLRWLLLVGGLAAAYGLVTFLAFRSVGGALGVRPPLGDMPLALVWPYYSGAVPRSAHLVGPFLNDLYFGVWLAALSGLVLARTPRFGRPTAGGRTENPPAVERIPDLDVTHADIRTSDDTGNPPPVEGVPHPPASPPPGAADSDLLPEKMRPSDVTLAVLVLAALAWTYSRSAALGLVAAVGDLALRGRPWLLLVLALVALTAVPLLQPHDRLRFLDSQASSAHSAGRFVVAERAWTTLTRGPFLGEGPGSVRLADTQYAKWVVETGWPGALALAWLMLTLLAPALRPSLANQLGLSAAVLALLVGGLSSELFEVPQVALSLWILAGLRKACASPPTLAEPANLTPSPPTTRQESG